MRLHTVGLLSLAAACSDPAEPGTKPSTPSDPPNAPGEIDTALPPPDRDAPGVSSAQAGEADAEPEPESIHRALKRMSVAQTRASMEHLSGGITWTDEQSNLWESYAETLGVADYQTRLRDNLDPSIMYQKFLEDAAVQTCSEWVSGEASGARSAPSVLPGRRPRWRRMRPAWRRTSSACERSCMARRAARATL